MSDHTLPLDFFDESRTAALPDAGFMPGGFLPPQKAHVRIEKADLRYSEKAFADGTNNIGLNFRVRVLQGERNKGGSFFWTLWLRSEDKAKQQKITNILFGLAKDVGVTPELPANTREETLRTYAQAFEGREFIAGVGQDFAKDRENNFVLDEKGQREVRGNRVTGHEPAKPEAIAKLTAAFTRRQGTTKATAAAPSPFVIGD